MHMCNIMQNIYYQPLFLCTFIRIFSPEMVTYINLSVILLVNIVIAHGHLTCSTIFLSLVDIVSDENVYHLKRELGDIIWYWINACRALNIDPNDVIAENVKKLESRYPGGSFDAFYSENRQDGDLLRGRPRRRASPAPPGPRL